jgi:hypothetical protein
MLFLHVVRECEQSAGAQGTPLKYEASSVLKVQKYMTKVNKNVFDRMLGHHHAHSPQPSMADFSAVTDATNMLGDFDGVFDMFLQPGNVETMAQQHGLR